MFGFLKKRSGLTAGDAVELAKSGDVVLLDVRNADETAKGTAKGALLIPLGELEARGTPGQPGFEPALGDGKPVAVFCASGIRSGRAATALKAHGIDAHNIGGIGDWLRAGGAPG